MRRRLRLVWALLILLVGTLLPALTPRAVAASPADYSAMDRFGACVAGSRNADLIILVDESSSMQRTDGGNSRVTAAKYLTTQLARFAGDTQSVLNVRVDGFSTKFTPGSGWGTLNPGSLDGVLAQVDSFANRNVGQGTDYWLALDGARRTFVEHAQGENPNVCRALIFLTDGGLYIGKGDDEGTNPVDRPYDPENKLVTEDQRAVAGEKAEADICRSGGVADQLRATNVAVLGVGLLSDEADADTFDLMRRIVTGRSDKGTCGSLLDPVPGDFVLASDVDDLLMIFDKYRHPGDEPVSQEAEVCQGAVCPAGAHRIILDPSIAKVDVLATSKADAAVYLVPPNAAPIPVPPGGQQETTLAGAPTTVTYQWWSKHSVSITMERGSGAWTGMWQVVFVDPASSSAGAKSESSIVVQGDLRPALVKVDKDALRTGTKVPVAVGLVNGKGEPVDSASLAGKMSMDVALVLPSGPAPVAADLSKESVKKPVELALNDVEPGTYALRLALKVTTADWTDAAGTVIPGTELKPQVVEVPLEVMSPPNYPSVGDRVNFGSTEGELRASATLPINGGGCVWVRGDTKVTTAPSGVTSAMVSSTAHSRETCVKVPQGGKGELPLTLTSEQVGNGGLTGTFVVDVAPTDGPGDPVSVTVSYVADMHKPLNQTNFWLTFLVAALAGPLLPLGLLYLFKYLIASRFSNDGLRAVRVPVRVEGNRVLRDGGELAVTDDDLRNGYLTLEGRSQQIAGATMLARMGASPFGPGHAVLRPDSPTALAASDTSPEPGKPGSGARLPLAVQGHWVLAHDPNGPADAAEAWLLFSALSTAEQRQQLINTFTAAAPRTLAAMRAAAGDTGMGGPGGMPGPAGPGAQGGPTGGPFPTAGGPQPGGLGLPTGPGLGQGNGQAPAFPPTGPSAFPTSMPSAFPSTGPSAFPMSVPSAPGAPATPAAPEAVGQPGSFPGGSSFPSSGSSFPASGPSAGALDPQGQPTPPRPDNGFGGFPGGPAAH